MLGQYMACVPRKDDDYALPICQREFVEPDAFHSKSLESMARAPTCPFKKAR